MAEDRKQDQPTGQSDAPSGGPSRSNRKKWVWLAGGVVGLLLIIGVIAVVALRVEIPGVGISIAEILGGTPPENTAKYFPDDVLTYSWMTLNPGDGQRGQMMDIWERFDELPGFGDAVDDLLEEFRDDTGIDVEDDVLPWIGPEMSVAVLDARDLDSPDVAAVIGVRDHGAAEDFLEKWLEYVEDEEGADFYGNPIGNFDVWIDERQSQAYALSKDWLVFATTEDALEDVLDLVSGDGRGQSLADDAVFQEARAAMPDRRFASLYVDLEAFKDAVDELSGMGIIPGAGGLDSLAIPGWAAVSAQWVDRGLVVEAVSPTTSEFVAGFPSVDEPAKILPGDTLGFAAVSFDPNYDNWLDELDRYTLGGMGVFQDALMYELADVLHEFSLPGDLELEEDTSLADLLEWGVEVVDELTGINLADDFFAYLNGQFIASVQNFDFERVEDADEYAVDATAMLSYVSGNEGDLTDTMDEVADWIESSAPIESDSEDVGAGQDAVVFDLEPLAGETAYSPGYMLHRGYLTVGTTVNALKSIVASQNGDDGTLNDMPEYQRALGYLPDSLQGLLFVDLQKIITQLDPDEMGMDDEDYEILEEGFSAVALGYKTGEEYSRAAYAMTLFPE